LDDLSKKVKDKMSKAKNARFPPLSRGISPKWVLFGQGLGGLIAYRPISPPVVVDQ
jgi:hypothetical protein